MSHVITQALLVAEQVKAQYAQSRNQTPVQTWQTEVASDQSKSYHKSGNQDCHRGERHTNTAPLHVARCLKVALGVERSRDYGKDTISGAQG